MLYEGNGVSALKAYVLSVVAAAILCTIVQVLLGKKSAVGRIAHLLSGILMAITVIAPLGQITFQGISEYWDDLSYDAQKYVTDGTSVAENQMREIIKARTEAYILDKANRMGLQIAVEVELDGYNGNIPCAVVIDGTASPYAKEQLSSYIEEALGIAKENQKWT